MTPQTPDFEQIAQEVADVCACGHVDEIAAALVEVWNARGAADLVALEDVIGKLGDTMDPDNARVFVGDSLRAIDADDKY